MNELKITPERFDELLAAGQLDGNPYLPIMFGLRAGKCAILSVFQTTAGQTAEAFAIPETDKGIVIQIGDDLDQSRGVAGFDETSLQQMFGKVDGVILQVADFRSDVMEAVARSVSSGATMAIVETRERHEIEWYEYIKAAIKEKPMLVITTRDEA